MTTPAFDYKSQVGSMNREIDSGIAGSEWSSFLAKRKELLDTMMQVAMPHPPPIAPPGPDGQPGVSLVPIAPGSTMQKPTSDMVGQAHFWGIQNPEQMSAADLQHQIEQRRAEVPRDKQTSLTSALFAGGAAAASAAGGAAELIGHAFQNLGTAADQIPFVGPALSSMLSNDQSKLFWQNLQSRASEAVEAASAMQPESDKSAFQFLTGAGKMAGYALPAIAAWEGLGAVAGIPRLSWLGRVATPLARVAAKGALTSAILEDPDVPIESKIMNLGLGAVMGGASMWGPVGTGVILGGIGAGVGGQIGDTPEERKRNAIEFGVGAAALPLLAPVLAQAFSKVKAAFPDGAIPVDQQIASAPPGTVDAEWEFIHDDKPQISGNPVPQRFKALGASGQPSPTDAEGLSALLHSEPPMQLGAGGELAPAEPVQDAAGLRSLIQGGPRALLEPPQRQTGLDGTDTVYESLMRDHDYYSRIANDLEYRQSQRIDDTNLPYGVTDPTAHYQSLADQLFGQAQVARLENRQQAKLKNGFAEVTAGPQRLVGSKVADTNGNPLRVYHGTEADFSEFDPTKLDSEALFGPGIYHTESPEIAGGYAGDMTTEWKDGAAQQVQRQISAMHDNGELTNDLSRALFNGVYLNINPDPTLFAQVGIDITPLIQTISPNVRPAFLDIKNPFDIDRHYAADEAHALVDKFASSLPEFDWNSVRDNIDGSNRGLDEYGISTSGGVTGEELYYDLSQVRAARQGPSQEVGGWLEIPADPMLGKAGLNQMLQRVGYDGITHIGGARTGNAPHRVWIAFDPTQVHSPFLSASLDAPSAQSAAEAITKQATVMESGTLPQAIGKVEVTEADVVDAVKHTNPGGTAIIRGVGRPLDVMREHPDVRFVERGGKLDALVGDFTDEQVKDYERYGTYEGNIVTTASGIEGRVLSISGKGMATLGRIAGGPPLRVKVYNLLPSRYGTPEYTGADLWPSFKADLLRYMNEESQKAGMAPVESLWDPRVPSQIQQHLEDYLNRRGINDPGTRHAIDLAINDSFVDEARNLDPEAKEMQARLGDQATVEANDRETGDEPIPVSLEEKAEARGFTWLSRPDADGGTFRDLLNPEGAFETNMQTDEAAEEFLQSVDRTAPDLAPASDVPFEVMESVPTGTSFEPATGHEEAIETLNEDVRGMEKDLSKMEMPGPGERGLAEESIRARAKFFGYDPEEAVRIYHNDIGFGAGGSPPSPPDVPSFGGGTPELPPGHQETLGDQFQRMYRTQPEKWAELERRWSGNHFRYTRYLMASLENDLVKSGLDLGRAWRDVTELETARAKSDNEAYDWLKEGGEIFRGMGAKDKINPLLRNGFITRTHEITNDAERYRRWWSLQDKGFSEAEVKKLIDADEKLRDIYHRLFMSGVESPSIGFRPEQEITRYISHVRQRQAQGPLATDPYDSRGLLSPVMQFFAEFAREGNVQFRVMNTRTLFNYYVRSMMFKKYQAAPYENLVRRWQDPRVPANISKLMTDHASAMRFGYRPEPTMAVKAVQGMVEGMLGVPITTGEAARITGGPLGWMYRSLLGGKTSIFFRDATQPLMALAKVRAGHMAGVYRDVMAYWKGGEGKEQLLQDYATALKHGWVTRERPSMEAATAFETEPGSETQLLGLTPAQAAARERIAKVGDAVFPHWLERFDNVTNTLRLYGKEQQLNQFIPGLAAYRQAKAGLAEYRQLETQAALSGNASVAMDYATFARKSFFSSFGRTEARSIMGIDLPAPQHRAISVQLKELVDAGNDEEAAATFAREVVKWSQQVYTVREKPAALRGGFGRMASFLGNFTGQFIEGTNAAMRYGEPEHIARALMVIGGFSYAMKKLGDQLGLRNLGNWAWSSSLHYAGSPLLEMGAQAVLAVGGGMAQADNRSASPLQNEAVKDAPNPAELALDFFPYTGYMRSAGAISEAAQGTTPVSDIARYMVTGDRGSGINFLLQQRARAVDFQQRYDPHTGTLRPAPVGIQSPNGGTMQQSVPTSGAGPSVPGMLTPGNINLNNRPTVHNRDGTISTVRSISINEDGREILIPTVSDNGVILTNNQAVDLYHRTGKHLGIFSTPAAATAYAQRLHQQQAQQYGHPGSGGRQ